MLDKQLQNKPLFRAEKYFKTVRLGPEPNPRPLHAPCTAVRGIYKGGSYAV